MTPCGLVDACRGFGGFYCQYRPVDGLVIKVVVVSGEANRLLSWTTLTGRHKFPVKK